MAPPEAWRALEAVAPSERRIDVWWRDDPSGYLMLLLAYLITRDPQWEDAHIRMIAGVSGSENDAAPIKENLALILEDIRIDAAPLVVVEPDPFSIAQNSENAALVLMPFSCRRWENSGCLPHGHR